MTGSRKDEGARGDTIAWLWAAIQVVGPVLLALVTAVLLSYGLIHFVFLS